MGAQNQKSVGKFFSFGTQISSKFAGGSGAEPKQKLFLKILFKKSSSFSIKVAHLK